MIKHDMHSHSPHVKHVVSLNGTSPAILESIPRILARSLIGLESNLLPFSGYDLWTVHNLSWLNHKGRSVNATGEFEIPIRSSNILDSKSLDNYVKKLKSVKFHDFNHVFETLEKDLSLAVRGDVKVRIFPKITNIEPATNPSIGKNIDLEDVHFFMFPDNPEILTKAVKPNSPFISETLSSNLLRSKCLTKNIPVYGSIIIQYKGMKISHSHLLCYINSFNNLVENHEQRIEKIFIAILNHCHTLKLSVFSRTRRHENLDITSFRRNHGLSLND